MTLNYNIIEESLEFFDESIGDYYTSYAKKQSIAAIPYGFGAGLNVGVGIKTLDGHSLNLKDASLMVGGAALFAGGAAYLINKYKNSYLRYSRIVYRLESKLKKDPNNKELKEKLNEFIRKKEEARKRAYIEEKDFINKTKELEFKLNQMKKNKEDINSINKLKNRIETRKRTLLSVGVDKI